MTEVKHKVKETADNGARRAIMEELFYDFHKRRAQVYWINFFRGLFFGVGSVLGGTVVIALLVWLLSWLIVIPGGIGDFVKNIVDLVQQRY